ncbi:hypothetical protein [Methylomonas fluvii]|uniref:Uncharacterized protein n=1 Tax=Methylomonas fluvii TaxID=1854564 RepID=A0ABR9DI62_9GAMM|nr:hypothetical protein [Methylomonas fluvii]MBD9362605.1 hypothetical protein [Methylomonas fluvii]
MTIDKNKNWSYPHTTICILFVFIFPFIIYLHEKELVDFLNSYLVKAWFIIIAGFFFVILTVGHGVTGSWKGAFVDNRNIMSLSRFQILGWTILILSAFSTVAIWNMFVTNHDCLKDIENGCLPGMPKELWLLMGISTASMVGSPLILDSKKSKIPDQQEKSQMLELLTSQQGYKRNELDIQGHLVVNQSPSQARFADLFTGEEIGNFAHLDLARLQMFFFTAVSIIIYGVQLGEFLSLELAKPTSEFIKELPTLNSSLLALIGISHTGYLAAKGVSNSQSGSSTDAESPPATGGGAVEEHPAVG